MLLKRGIAFSIALGLLVIPTIISYAETYDADVMANIEATVFDVTVPLSFPIHIDSEGNCTTSEDLKIVNNSVAPVWLEKIEVVGTDGWFVGDYGKDYTSNSIDTKEFGVKINDVESKGDSFIWDYGNPLNLIKAKKDGVPGELKLNYDFTASPQSTTITDEVIANITMVVRWL